MNKWMWVFLILLIGCDFQMYEHEATIKVVYEDGIVDTMKVDWTGPDHWTEPFKIKVEHGQGILHRGVNKPCLLVDRETRVCGIRRFEVISQSMKPVD